MADLQAGQETPVNDEDQAEAALQSQADPKAEATEGADKGDETQVEKTYSKQELQEAIERATAKASAKAERRAFREATERLSQVQQPVQEQRDSKPSRQSGETDDAFLDRLTDWKLDQRDRQSQQARHQEQNQKLQSKTEGHYAQAEKIPGFDRDDFDSLDLTPAIASAITDSDVAPKLMAYMASNPDEVKRIAGMSPARQAAEVGRLEAKLSTTSTSKAAPPITPIGNRGKAIPSLEDASLEEYARIRKAQGASWAR